jgi:hypothetical protein
MYGAGRAGAAAAGVGAAAAEGMLPFTGIALGVYMAIGIGLIVAGLLIRRTANQRLHSVE